jgi:hypothetical protein
VSSKGAHRKHPSTVQLLLLTGVPGTGKTTLGNYLREQHGFRHLDFETNTRMTFLGDGSEAQIRTRVNRLKKEGRDAVISWGFVPDQQLGFALILRTLGFSWIWLDGNREASRRAFVDRGTVSEGLYNAQMHGIKQVIDPQIEVLAPVVINPFDESGEFFPCEEIVKRFA